jgi:uncharacterized protein (TIGR02996 family)
MGIEEALLADIVEHPDDDTPRLVYADWLEEHGPPQAADRAEFIRLQCRLARMPEEDDNRPDLERRCRILLRRYGSAWRGTLAGIDCKVQFRRGFIDHVEMDSVHFLLLGADWVGTSTVRRATIIHATAETFVALAAGPCLGRLTGLTLRPPRMPLGHYAMPTEALLSLTRAPQIATLRSLDLGHFDFHDADGEALATSAHLGSLEELALAHTSLPPQALAAIVGSPRLTQLQSLDLSWNGLQDGMQVLAGPSRLPRLNTLILAHTTTSRAPLTAFLESAVFAGLSVLDVRAMHGPDLHVPEVLAAAPRPPGLHDLRVVGTETLPALLASPLATALTVVTAPYIRRDTELRQLLPQLQPHRLHTLSLKDCYLEPSAVPILAAWPGVRGLRSLDLERNALKADGTRLLASAAEFGRLRCLDLGHNSIGPAGARALAKSPHLTRLQDLRLNWCDLEDEGAVALAHSPTLRNLAALNLKGNRIGDAGGRALAESPHLEALEKLELQANPLSGRTRRQLVERFGADTCFFQGLPLQ